jgi:hypothetical protein
MIAVGTIGRLRVGLGTSRSGRSPFAGAAALYALRVPEGINYTGPVVRVRRSSDNAELDIGSVAGQLDTAALLAHTGGGSGFVATWYDISGNARHATQTTAASQPRIVNAGVVDTINGAPSLVFSGAQRLLCGGTRFGDSTNFTSITTFRREDAAITPRSAYGNRVTSGRILRTTNTTILYAHINGSFPAAIAYTNATAVVHSAIVESGVLTRHRVNGASEQSSVVAFISAGGSMQLGTSATGAEFFVGPIGEMIFFDATISNADRLTLERSQGAAFGISVA